MTHRVITHNLMDGEKQGWSVATCVYPECHWSYVAAWTADRQSAVQETMDALYKHREETYG